MTREEAKRIAQGLITDFKCDSETMVDFCNTAIKALEQQPCEDAISRKEAINAVKDLSEHYANNQREFHPHIDFVVERLEELPSVQPFSRTFDITYRYERKPVEDCVSRELLLKHLENITMDTNPDHYDSKDKWYQANGFNLCKVGIEMYVKNLPSVTPQQPCNDCRFANDNSICEVCCHKYSSMFTDMRGDKNE